MSHFSRRGIAALVVASVLVFAPLVSTAAFADEEPVETPVVETPPAETPPAETPPGETPSEEAPAEEPPMEEAPAGEQPSEESPDDLPADDESPSGFAPMSFAAEPDCDVSATDQGITLCVDFVGTTVTLSVNRTAFGDVGGYHLRLYDYVAGEWIYLGEFPRPQTTSTPPITVIPGRLYYAAGDDSMWTVGTAFTLPLLAAPNEPANVTVERLSAASGFHATWEAPAEVVDNVIVSYDVTVTPTAGNPTTYSTTGLEYQLTGLVVGQEYTIAVTSVADDGQSSDASSVTATLEPVAPTAVSDLVLSRDGGDLSASWTAPSYDGGDSPVRYAVKLLADDLLVDSYDQLATTIDFPRPAEYGVEYSVMVSPFTAAVSGGPPATSNTVERPDSVPNAPTAFASPYGHKNAMIYTTWDLTPSASSPVEDVILSLYDIDGALVDRVTLDLGVGFSGWSFDELANETAYSIGVMAVNGAGSSAESTRVPATTLGLVPPPLTPLELALVGNVANVTVSLTGTTLKAHISGLHEGDWVFGYAHSTPAPLGWTQVDAAGFASWSISGAGLGAGTTHTLVVMDSFGSPLGTAGFAIAAARPAALAQAGTDPSGWMTIAAAMLALGILAVSRRTRRDARG